jgi:hypothetical protein
MVSFKIGVVIGTLIAAAGLAAMPVQALTLRECGAAYRAAKSAGTLGGMTWQDFRRAKCGPNAGAATGPTTGERKGPAAGGSAYLPGAVFPSSVAPKYSDETPGRARMHTCLDQYRLNKVNNANGGLKWVQKGGGYYSECNKRLKPGPKH